MPRDRSVRSCRGTVYPARFPPALTDDPFLCWGVGMRLKNTHSLRFGHIVRIATIFVTAMAILAPLSAQQAGEGADSQPSITDQELADFVEALGSVQQIQQQMVSETQSSVADSDLGQQRFQEMYQARQNGTEPDSAPTQTEKDEFDRVIAEIQGIQQDSNQRMVSAVQDAGLDVERFNQIAQAVQSDSSLMERLQEVSSESGT